MSAENPGRFGPYGGAFVSETLIPAIHELSLAYREAVASEAFQNQFHQMLVEYGASATL